MKPVREGMDARLCVRSFLSPHLGPGHPSRVRSNNTKLAFGPILFVNGWSASTVIFTFPQGKHLMS